MFVIRYKADGVPICCQVPGVNPDPVVVWSSETAARAFIKGKNAGDDFEPVAISDESMDAMAKALGCPVASIVFEQYPS